MRRLQLIFALSAKRRVVVFAFALALGWVFALGNGVLAAEGVEQKTDAPKNQLIVGSQIGGVFYAAKPLKEEYDNLLAKVQVLRQQIADGTISSRDAAGEVRTLQEELQRVRKSIDESKTLVSYGKTTTKTETEEFALAPEKLLFISGISKLKLVGWENPVVKCVLEKTVISDGKEPLDDHFADIRLVHRHGPATSEEVGRSVAEKKAAQEEYLQSPDGKKLTSDQVKAYYAWWEKSAANDSYFRAFQEKPIDSVTLEGLTHQQGNRQVSYQVMSDGGNGQAGSVWQRHAELTIYVPRCTAVGLRGGMGGLEANGLKAALIVRGDGDRNYESKSHVKDHEGALTTENVPLETVENIRGNVSVTVSADLGNAGTMHRDGGKTQYVELPATYTYRRIDGDLTALLLNVNLKLSDVTGRIDVKNEFGDTQFTTRKPLSAAAHRIFSESGNILLQLTPQDIENAPLVAASECGSVKAADSAPPLVDGNVSGWPGDGTVRRTYRGFATQDKADRFGPFFSLIENFDNKLRFYVRSRAGNVRIEGAPK